MEAEAIGLRSGSVGCRGFEGVDTRRIACGGRGREVGRRLRTKSLCARYDCPMTLCRRPVRRETRRAGRLRCGGWFSSLSQVQCVALRIELMAGRYPG